MSDFPRSVAITANSDVNIYRFRAPIIHKLVEMGVIVYAIAPPGRFVADLERMGAVFIPWSLDRRSINPLLVVWHIILLVRIYWRLKPDLAHHFTIKPNLYGAIAARLTGVPVVLSGVTGLGVMFSATTHWRRVLRSCTILLYRISAKLSDLTTFQSQHDRDVLIGASPLKEKGRIIKGGSGIDLVAFSPDVVSIRHREKIRAELGIEQGMLVVCMASRLLYDKGVAQYMEAARRTWSKRSDICFILAGEPDPGNSRSVTDKDLENWASEGFVKQVGYRNDIKAIFAVSDIVVHPTCYMEGIPRVLIEAAAMGKPVVTTMAPGVAEVVEHGVNGVCIPPGDEMALAAAIESLLADADVRRRYGTAGRRKAEAGYDARSVADRHLAEYRRVWMDAAPLRRRVNAKKCAFAPSLSGSGPNQSGASVSVIIPARNAEATISATLDSVLSQEYTGPFEVIVADGSDFPAMAEMIRASYPDVRIVPNPDKSIPSGLNRAISESSGEVIVRCDAHAVFPPGYVRRAVGVLKRTGAANVGGRQQARGMTFFGRAVALAMNSPLGSGGSVYRSRRSTGPADTVYLGTWHRDTLEALGGFDTRMIRNEDYDINWRLRQRGGIVWFDPELVTAYRPREDIASLARQYFNFGRWKSTMIILHPTSLKLRHLAAPLLTLGLAASLTLGLAASLTLGLAASLTLGLAASLTLGLAASLTLGYLAVLLLGSVALGLRHMEPAAVILPVVLMTMHLSWGVGFFLPARLRTYKGLSLNISDSRP